MTDYTKESLSALIDGEASEIEVHKLLRHIKSIHPEPGENSQASEDLHASWARYQEIRSVVGSSGADASSQTTRLDASQHLALRLRISHAIETEAVHELEGVSSLSSVSGRDMTARSTLAKYRAPAAGLAIAASLVVAIFVGLKPLENNTSGNTGSDAVATLNAPSTTNDRQPISAQTVSTQSGSVNTQNSISPATSRLDSLEQQLLSSGEEGMLVDHSELKELNDEQRQQMRAYLQLHDRMTRSNSNRRTVNFNGSKD